MNYQELTFKSICNFIIDLSDMFGGKNHGLKLYEHLLGKTTMSHTKAVNKHIELFTSFCVDNRDAILNKDHSKLVQPKIEYSEKVFVDMNSIFSKADSETTDVIWKHLLTISAFVDPTAKAKDILKKNALSGDKESVFLNNMFNKFESNIKPSSNPMETITSMLTSGVLNDVANTFQSGLQNGELNMNNLIGTANTLISSILPPNTDGSSNKINLDGILNTVLAGAAASGPSAGQGQNIDFNALLSGFASMAVKQQQVPLNEETVIEEVKKEE